jgi:hypothetical protein
MQMPRLRVPAYQSYLRIHIRRAQDSSTCLRSRGMPFQVGTCHAGRTRPYLVLSGVSFEMIVNVRTSHGR